MFLDEYLCKYLKRRGRRLYVSKRGIQRQRQAQEADEAAFFVVMSRKTKMAPGEAG
jgi:hypothetical protein